MSKMPPGHWMRRFGYGTLFLSTFARGGLPNRASAWPGPYDVGDQVRLLKATRGGDSATDAPITIPAGSVGTVEEIERYGHAPAKFALVISGKGWATSQPHGTAQRYIVYGGYGEPLGILNYGGKYYYSDEPPWETPLDLAEGIYRTKRRSKLRLVSVGSVSDEVFEKAQYNERSGKYRKGMI